MVSTPSHPGAQSRHDNSQEMPLFLSDLKRFGATVLWGHLHDTGQNVSSWVVVQSGGNSREAFGMQGDTSLVPMSQG